MSDMRDKGGLGRELFIIGLADALKDCRDIHDPIDRAITIFRAIEENQAEACRRECIRRNISRAKKGKRA